MVSAIILAQPLYTLFYGAPNNDALWLFVVAFSLLNLSAMAQVSMRLVIDAPFCLYAEDAGIFGKRSIFHDYLSGFESKNMRNALIRLFKVLDTKIDERDPYLEKELAQFPYVNGGLFSDQNIEIPNLLT